jgi:hypothetical protein
LPVWLPLVLTIFPLVILFAAALAQEQSKEDRAWLLSLAVVHPLLFGLVLGGAFPEDARRIVGEAGGPVADFVGMMSGVVAWLGAVWFGWGLFLLTALALRKAESWKKPVGVLLVAAWFIGLAVLAWHCLGGLGQDQVLQTFIGWGAAIGGGGSFWGAWRCSQTPDQPKFNPALFPQQGRGERVEIGDGFFVDNRFQGSEDDRPIREVKSPGRNFVGFGPGSAAADFGMGRWPGEDCPRTRASRSKASGAGRSGLWITRRSRMPSPGFARS